MGEGKEGKRDSSYGWERKEIEETGRGNEIQLWVNKARRESEIDDM